MPGMYLPRITELAMLEHEQEKQRRAREEERTSRDGRRRLKEMRRTCIARLYSKIVRL